MTSTITNAGVCRNEKRKETKIGNPAQVQHFYSLIVSKDIQYQKNFPATVWTVLGKRRTNIIWVAIS